MTALAIAPTLFDAAGGEPTLDELIVGAWEGLAAQQSVACPVCDGELVAEYGARSHPAAEGGGFSGPVPEGGGG
jgi:hypothetical protein